MNKEEKLNKINNELKGYLNEAKFISNKCRNSIIKILGEEFNIEIDKKAYVEFANVDVQIDEDGNIILRGDLFKAESKKSIDEIEEIFNRYKERVNNILKKKEINFESKNDFNNIVNLVIVGFLVIIFIIITLFVLSAILNGNLYFGIWFVVFVLPYIIPSLKDNLRVRLEQAKNYIKRLGKRKK